nr:hypothetical protein [uncultured Oscillibacter sp.]
MAAKMVEKTGGDKVELRVSGTKVYLGDDEMVLNLSKYERDDPVHIDIGLNARGFLTFGVSDRYAVQLDIPGREYELVDSGELDENGSPRMKKVAKPFSMNNVTITLWGRPAESDNRNDEGGEDDE